MVPLAHWKRASVTALQVGKDNSVIDLAGTTHMVQNVSTSVIAKTEHLVIQLTVSPLISLITLHGYH